MPKVLIKRLPHAEGLPLPSYQTSGAAGADLVAAIDEPVVIAPGSRAMIPTGLQIALPEGYEAQVRPRSGLAAKHGITVLNSPGTVDADYRGEVKVMLVNTNSASSSMSGRATSFTIERDDLEMAPFDGKGGMGQMYALFGDGMDTIMTEMNEALSA